MEFSPNPSLTLTHKLEAGPGLIKIRFWKNTRPPNICGRQKNDIHPPATEDVHSLISRTYKYIRLFVIRLFGKGQLRLLVKLKLLISWL